MDRNSPNGVRRWRHPVLLIATVAIVLLGGLTGGAQDLERLASVKRWTAEGMPSETWGLGHTRRFRPSEAMAWARERRARLAARRDREATRPGHDNRRE